MNPPSTRAGIVALVVLAWAAGPATAQGRLTPNTLVRDAQAPAPAATLADAAWLAGSWRAEALGGIAEETWAPPSGGSMLGMFKLLHGGEVSFYEIFALVEQGGTLVLKLKHFDAQLRGWEEREEVVEFPLVRLGADTLWLEGLTFAREGPDRLIVHLAMGKGDAVREETFGYRRVR
ncbi:MAG TPA: DUF6265 family protein [Longimicrobiales bacterium]|nr:DUF6265 family protein [Longimicrobiales bacterium]